MSSPKHAVLALLVVFLAAISLSVLSIPPLLLPAEAAANVSQLEVSHTAPGCPGKPISISVSLGGASANARLQIHYVQNQTLATLIDLENVSGTSFTPTAPGDYLIEAIKPGVIKGAASFSIKECITCKSPLILNEKTGKCECPSGTHYNSVTKQCVECGSPRVWIEESLSCICPDGKFYAAPNNACISCNPPRIWDAASSQCACPPNQTYVEAVDKCVSCSPPLIINTKNGLCECPPGQALNIVNSTCERIACAPPTELNPITLQCECPPPLNYDPNASACVKCEQPFSWDVIELACKCPGDTLLQDDNKTCCSVSFCSKSAECCSGFCSSNLCIEPPSAEKISPFHPKSPVSLLFWLLAIAFSSISAYLSYREGTPFAVAVFIALPFLSALLISPFSGFVVSVAELLVTSLIASLHKRKGGRKEKGKDKQRRWKPPWDDDGPHFLELPPPE